MGMLTQLAAATATKGTQRATRGGAFCGEKAEKSHHEYQCNTCKDLCSCDWVKGTFSAFVPVGFSSPTATGYI